jgi:hypothetical protein
VRREIKRIGAGQAGEWCDVRLQVYADGAWALRWGPSDYDLDHRGAWGASCVPCAGRYDSVDVARDLLSQVCESQAQDAE